MAIQNASGEITSRVVAGEHLIPFDAAGGNMARATNAAATLTLTPASGEGIILASLDWSYSSAPTGGNLAIKFGSTVVWQWDITAGGPGFRDWPRGRLCPTDQVVTIELAAGGGGVVGTVNVEQWDE